MRKPAEAPGPVLVVDDDPNHLKVLTGLLRLEGLECLAAGGVDAALPIVEREPLALVITDLVMPGRSGLDLLAHCRERRPALPVILVSGQGDVESAVAAMKRGAYDFITKPVDEDELLAVVRKALAEARKDGELVSAYFEPARGGFPDVVGSSPALAKILETVARVGPTDATVFISGETGVGKEMIVKALHAASPRRNRPLVKLNCAAIPETLAESELFGHERGAFTGAATAKPGRFELADQGTLFLDEIGEMPLPLQAKLLGVLQDRAFERVGGVATIRVDVRVIAATNRDLAADVKAGRFRADLFYRLNVVPIHVPPLRERREDVAPLAAAFLARFARRHGKGPLHILPEAVACLVRYDWPGNIRELENAVERMVLMADSDAIGPGLLPAEIVGGAAAAGGHGTLREKCGGILEVSERQMILEALEKTGQNRTRAAELLGIGRRTLQNKIRAYGI